MHEPRGSNDLVTERLHYTARHIFHRRVSRAFSALRVYSKFRHHLHPLGYICAKFRFFSRPPRIAELAHGEKSSNLQSLTQSPSLFDAPLTEAFASE